MKKSELPEALKQEVSSEEYKNLICNDFCQEVN